MNRTAAPSRPGSVPAAGFTLIELIIVVAILAFVAMVGLRGYANVRENQARKVNVSNLKRIAHSLATYETMDSNRGMRDTGLYKSLGIFYLSTNDVTLLRNAGVTQVLMHNPSTQQAYGTRRNGYCTAMDDNGYTSDGLLSPGGGGPGFRPDMSAFYPVTTTNGVPVAVIRPNSTIYNDLGYQCAFTNTSPSASDLTAAISGQKTKLLAFGIGINAECVKNQIGLGDAPYNPVFDRKNYRQYIAVFALTTRGQGTPSTCRFAGVVDCAGNTYRAASYNANWTTSLN